MSISRDLSLLVCFQVCFIPIPNNNINLIAGVYSNIFSSGCYSTPIVGQKVDEIRGKKICLQAPVQRVAVAGALPWDGAALFTIHYSIGVGTMGAVGAAAPTIFSRWVQTMYSAPTILWNKTPFHHRITEDQLFYEQTFFIIMSMSQATIIGVSTGGATGAMAPHFSAKIVLKIFHFFHKHNFYTENDSSGREEHESA